MRVRSESLKFLHRLFRAVGGNRHIVAGGAHVDARHVQVQLGQPRRFRAVLASAHNSLHDCCVDATPEGVTNIEQSMERDRPAWDVTNDAAVRLPDHAPHRVISTSVHSVVVRTTRLTMSIHPGANLPVSRLCTGRIRA